MNDGGHRLTASASAFTNANNVSIKDSSFNITTTVNAAIKPVLDVLYERVAPNAILNEGGRADEPKCHPGTREEVIKTIERWIDAVEGSRILWLSGPAGGGKTAIMKTITERSASRGVQTINFFFFRGDSTRKSAQPFVPTLLYQLFQVYPHLSETVAAIFSTHPRVLDTSLAEQSKLISVLAPVIRQLLPTGAQIILVVDALDECDVDAERAQGDILRVLERLVMEDNSVFRLLIASRPEARIKLAFNRLSSKAQAIFLDEEYLPEKDIRLFVTTEFDNIKASHPSAGSLPSDWPALSDVEAIVTKSSGQFIYAATVMRYIADAAHLPSLALERVKGVIPPGNNSPYKHLDSIYAFILSQAEDRDTMRDMFSMTLLDDWLDNLVNRLPYCYTHHHNVAAILESCITNLSAIAWLTKGSDLKFHHASMVDFLLDHARSGEFWIDLDAFRGNVLVAIWGKSVTDRAYDMSYVQPRLLNNLRRPTPQMTHMLLKSPFPTWTLDEDRECMDFLRPLQKLYYEHDINTYKRIVRRFIRALSSRHINPRVDGIPYAWEYQMFNYWQRLLRGVLFTPFPKSAKLEGY